MMVEQLNVLDILRHAATVFPDREIVDRAPDGTLQRKTYSEAFQQVGRLTNALAELGVQAGDRVGTVAWSTIRHFELFYAIPAIGAVCHTINPRFTREQIVDTINRAGDRVLFVDPDFLELIADLRGEFHTVETIIALSSSAIDGVPCYDDLLKGQAADHDRPAFDERSAAFLSFTSGTTGAPKGVLYSHRSVVLHAMGNLASGVKPQRHESCVMPMASMFHVTAWGHPFLCPMVGSKLVLPGSRLDAISCYELIDKESVTLAYCVPTLLERIFAYVSENELHFHSLKAVACGGAPTPRSLVRTVEEKYGVEFIPGWGMTETSPTGAAGYKVVGQPEDRESEVYWRNRKKNRAVFGLQMKIVDEDENELPRDGVASGELVVRGNWVVGEYFGDPDSRQSCFTRDGWFRTGDVATIDRHGRMEIVDRIKDLIKSGGEWISSIELEQAALRHPAVEQAAAVAVPDPKWIERPVAFVCLGNGLSATEDEIKETMRQALDQKWKVPDRIIIVDSLPHTPTGKVAKRLIRERFSSGSI
ncbi:long-chain-fatty-acid--CoA ligase [Aliihoeflea sp. PC F10.4]